MLTTGNVFFVDSGASLAVDSTAHGDSPERPFATLDYAVGRCTANNNDVVYVMAGHSETLTADSAVDLDVAGEQPVVDGDVLHIEQAPSDTGRSDEGGVLVVGRGEAPRSQGLYRLFRVTDGGRCGPR